MLRGAVFVALLVLSGHAFAAEPVGCDKFKWSIAAEQKALAADDKQVASATPLDRTSAKAVAMSLVPFAEAKFVLPPERQPKDPKSFAGVVQFAGGDAGTYKITLSAGAWIDVAQNGKLLKSVDFSGAVECPYVRKSVQFKIGPQPFAVQLSGVDEPAIDFVVTKGE